MCDQLNDVAEHGITERELAIAKGNLRADTLLTCEDSGARMSRIGASRLLHGDVIEIDDLIGRIESLTLDEVRTEARRLVGAPRTLSVVGPVDEDSFDVGALGLG
jgi:predicted Zn-dependent peptidase